MGWGISAPTHHHSNCYWPLKMGSKRQNVDCFESLDSKLLLPTDHMALRVTTCGQPMEADTSGGRHQLSYPAGVACQWKPL